MGLEEDYCTCHIKLTIGTRAVLIYHILSNLKDEASHDQIQETVSNWPRGFIRIGFEAATYSFDAGAIATISLSRDAR